MTRPRLEVVTRTMLTPRRREALVRQQDALTRVLGPGWTQAVLVDPAASGVPASHVRLRRHEPWADFAWVLDDDDLPREPFLHLLDPAHDLYVFRVLYNELDDFFPLDHHWEARAVECGFISPSNVVVSHDLWMAAREAWGERYEGDFDYLSAACRLAARATWVDVTVAEIMDCAHGRA